MKSHKFIFSGVLLFALVMGQIALAQASVKVSLKDLGQLDAKVVERADAERLASAQRQRQQSEEKEIGLQAQRAEYDYHRKEAQRLHDGRTLIQNGSSLRQVMQATEVSQ